MKENFLFPDEIAETLRNAEHGATVTLPDGRTFKVLRSGSYENGIVTSGVKYHDSFGSLVSEGYLINLIYDALDNDETVKLDGQNIWEV